MSYFFKIFTTIISLTIIGFSTEKLEFEQDSDLFDDSVYFLPRTMTQDVLFSMGDMDLDQDIVLFDFDETIATTSHLLNPDRANERITVRSNGGVLNLFTSMRETHPQSVFIYSSGSVFYARHHEIDLSLLPVDVQEMEKKGIYPTESTSEGDLIYKEHIHGILSYFPQFPAFHLNWNAQPKILQNYQTLQSIKGAYIEHIIHFLYESLGRKSPIRDIYLIDDQQGNLQSVETYAKPLKEKEKFTGHFIPIHVPHKK